MFTSQLPPRMWRWSVYYAITRHSQMKKRATLSSLCSQNQSVLILWDIFQSQFSLISGWKPLNPDWASWQPEALIVCFIKQSRSGLCLHVIIFIYFVRCLSFYDADSVFILLVLQFSREVLVLVFARFTGRHWQSGSPLWSRRKYLNRCWTVWRSWSPEDKVRWLQQSPDLLLWSENVLFCGGNIWTDANVTFTVTATETVPKQLFETDIISISNCILTLKTSSCSTLTLPRMTLISTARRSPYSSTSSPVMQ